MINPGSIQTLDGVAAMFVLWHFLLLGLCAAALLVERGLHRHPYVRSALLRSTLTLALLLPIGSVAWRLLPMPAAPEVASLADSIPARPSAALLAIDWSHVAVWRPLVADVEQAPVELLPDRSPLPPSPAMLCRWMAGASLLISGCLFLRFAIALTRIGRLRRSARPAGETELQRCRDAAARLGAPAPLLLVADGLASPILIGFFRPAILLPAGMALREEILTHELTHLRRRDLGWHLLARCAAMLMPLQPGFRLLLRALERADEDICDDAVLVRGASAAGYAKLLLSIVESRRAPDPEPCLPMAAVRSQIERRLRRLLDVARPLARRFSFPMFCLGLGPVIVAGAIAAAIFLDTERTADARDNPAANVPPKTDNQSFLDQTAFSSDRDKAAIMPALEAADDWHARLDRPYADAAPPGYLNDQPITPAAWHRYLVRTYSGYGRAISRVLTTMTRGGPPDSSDITLVTAGYETKFQSSGSPTVLAENLTLRRGSNGRWRVERFAIGLLTDPDAGPPSAVTPVVRSVKVEFVGGASIPEEQLKTELLAVAGLKMGEPCEVAQLQRAVKRLYATGQLANVAVKAGILRSDSVATGVEVRIVAEPNPVVRHITFRGVDPASQARLARFLKIKEGEMASDELVFDDARALTAELAREGRHLGATAASSLQVAPSQNTTDVMFTIAPL